MDGLRFINEMMDRGTEYPPIGHFFKFKILSAARGQLRCSGVPGPEHYNPLGVIHGGFASTLLDLALGHVSLTVLQDPATGVGTTDLNVKYIRAMKSSVGTVSCDATVVHAGNTIVVAHADLRDQAGTLYATAQSTCVVLRAKS